MSDRWLKRWVVASESGPGDYIVGQDAEGNWGCSCPGWTRNVAKFCPDCGSRLGKVGKLDAYCWRCRKPITPRVERIDCKHIIEVRNGGGKTIAEATLDRMAGR